MATLVIDASVATKWFLQEEGSARAAELREGNDELIAPDFAVWEVYNALWAAARAGRVSREYVASVTPSIPTALPRLFPSMDLFEPAARLALELNHPIYDLIFLALAERESATLVTADERLFMVGRRRRSPVRLL